MDAKEYKKSNKRKARKKRFSKNKYYYIFVVAIIIIVVAVLFISNGFSFDFSDKKDKNNVGVETSVDKLQNLTIRFLDVGQGDCIFITFPDGKNMLIDAGEHKENRDVIDKYLTNGGKKVTLDYCVATHPDSDHIDNLPYVYEQYDVLRSYRLYLKSTSDRVSSLTEEFNKGVIIDSKSKTNIYADYLNSVYNEKCEWEFFCDSSDFTNSVKVKDGGEYKYTVDFMMPYIEELNSFNDLRQANNLSAIIMIEYGGKKVLLTGDAEKKVEKLFVEKADAKLADCDVLKLGHHGSNTSSTIDFLNFVKPENVVISCGVSNKYHHPNKETIENVISCKSDVYRTDIQGTITITIDSSGNIVFNKEYDDFDGEMLFFDGDEIKLQAEKINKVKQKAA